jgi:hypothetical protein
MKAIKKGELYEHLSEFLKRKGVELHKGPYPGRIEQVCSLLTTTINATQATLGRARDGMDRGLQQVRHALRKTPPAHSPKVSPFAAPAPESPSKPRKQAAAVPSRTSGRKSPPRRKARAK